MGQKKEGTFKTGLERLRARMRGELPDPPVMGIMGMQIVAVEKGAIRFRAKPDHRHLNSQGVVMGGFAATVLDAAAGCAIQTLLEDHTRFATIQLNIHYIRPIRVNLGPLFGDGRILDTSRQMGFSEASLIDEKGRSYAHATGSFKIFR